ncbi:hypothetical protein DUNSADRAFT_3825 [Dunaliella salina]|uniref:Encoded protein n=1 Tax=Dunaliella salina TaxID=3046 RepID=A0ABQ7GT78_DUNSA|nr:hypothetical protein DUNSADRAFT_3825 [Dunaliella salina]|eukprot:KAF5837809.1 hypothetical protein DUNSADRAFT_3825 [Dunaliella salina]
MTKTSMKRTRIPTPRKERVEGVEGVLQRSEGRLPTTCECLLSSAQDVRKNQHVWQRSGGVLLDVHEQPCPGSFQVVRRSTSRRLAIMASCCSVSHGLILMVS